MKNYYVNVLPTAQREITDILNYIATELCSPLAAINLNTAFADELQRLKKFPLHGKLLQTKLPLKHVYRWVRVENYMIFYTVDEQAESIHIMHVRFASSDYLNILT